MPFIASRAQAHARTRPKHTHTQKFEALVINAKWYCAHKSIDEQLIINKNWLYIGHLILMHHTRKTFRVPSDATDCNDSLVLDSEIRVLVA